MFKKLFILITKFMPVIQLMGMIINNTLYVHDVIIKHYYILDFLFGNSVATCAMLYICSYTFGFCKWHRLIITANLINIFIATIDKGIMIPIKDIELLASYYIIASIFIILATYDHVKNIRNDERKNKDT